MELSLGRFIARCVEQHGCTLVEMESHGGGTGRYLLRAGTRTRWAVLPALAEEQPLTPELCWSLCNRLDIRG